MPEAPSARWRTHASRARPGRSVLPLVCHVCRSGRERLAAAGDQDAAPGREWKSARAIDVATLAELLRETGEHHGPYEKTHADHHWWDWYAPYVTRARTAAVRRTRPRPPIATWTRSSIFLPVDARAPRRPSDGESELRTSDAYRLWSFEPPCSGIQ